MPRFPLTMTMIVASLLLSAACSVSSNPQQERTMKISSAVTPDMMVDADAPEAKHLSKVVDAYLRNGYTIVEAQFYKDTADTEWSMISQYVASERAAGRKIEPGGGKPQRPEWHTMFDLIDVYPADNHHGAFAVAMAKEPLSDGKKLVGYFTLKPVK